LEEMNLWVRNEKEHQELKLQLADLAHSVALIPLLVKWVIFPLVVILGLPLGVERVIPLFKGLG